MISVKRHFLLPLVALLLMLSACERPPVESTQNGYRGTNMVDITNPRAEAEAASYPAALPAAPASGPKAGDVYENVQVLGDLSIAQFTRLMTAMTAWVSPEEGCNYCHNPANLAADDVYTKVVSRRMIQMTQNINANWQDHVGSAGVNCYTCHRGMNVPEYIWFEEGDSTYGNKYFAGWRDGQNLPDVSVGFTSLPTDAVAQYMGSATSDSVRVASQGGHANGDNPLGVKDAEHTFGVMINWSQSLGVNCTYCHTTASFQNWEQSTPQRITAYHGQNMVRALNEFYLTPLQSQYPDNRLGPHTGDAPKAYCMTCHQGQKKPLGGAEAVSAYPTLASD